MLLELETGDMSSIFFEKLPNRFVERINKEDLAYPGCWTWRNKYMGFYYQGKVYNPHRIMYQHVHGNITHSDHIVQTCGNRSCVFPDHLVISSSGAWHTYGSGRRKQLPQARFFSKVALPTSEEQENNNPCWLWTGKLDKRGLGQFHADTHINKPCLVHRYSYEILVGPLTSDQYLRHTCSNQHCVNPKHLIIREKQSTLYIPDRPGFLSPSDVEDIRQRWTNRYSTGDKMQTIAEDKNVHISTISLIVNNKRHVKASSIANV